MIFIGIDKLFELLNAIGRILICVDHRSFVTGHNLVVNVQ